MAAFDFESLFCSELGSCGHTSTRFCSRLSWLCDEIDHFEEWSESRTCCYLAFFFDEFIEESIDWSNCPANSLGRAAQFDLSEPAFSMSQSQSSTLTLTLLTWCLALSGQSFSSYMRRRSLTDGDDITSQSPLSFRCFLTLPEGSSRTSFHIWSSQRAGSGPKFS